MITIGFGDITPISNLEKIYVIFMSFIASGLFAYAINTIGSIFSDIEAKNASYKYIINFFFLQFENII